MKLRLLSLAAGLLLSSGLLQAVSISGLYNTGVDNSGTVIPGNLQAEQHYTLNTTGYSVTPVTKTAGWPISPWLDNNGLSTWIGPATNVSLEAQPMVFSYQLVFSLSGLNASTAQITGRIAADDSFAISLNNGTVSSWDGGFTSWTAFSLTSGFVSGQNVIDFKVWNWGGGPTGLRVELSGTADPIQVPDAGSSIALAFVSILGLAFLRRRKA